MKLWGSWAAVALGATAFNLGLLGISSDPEPLANLTTDAHYGRQTTYDVTNQTTVQELKHVVPGIFEPTKLFKSAEYPQTYTIAYARLVSKLARITSLRHNALVPLKEDIKENTLYQIRYAQIPGEEMTGPQAFAIGLSSLEAFASGWSAKSVLLGTEGNLQAKGAVATGFTDRWGVADIVDWFVEVRNTTVDVYVALNGKPYGHAFHLDFTEKPEVIPHLRPIVSFSENSDKSAVITVVFAPAAIPKSAIYRQHYPPDDEEGGSDLREPSPVGNWVLGESVKLTIRETAADATTRTLRVSGKVINTINMSMTVDAHSGKVLAKSPPISTLMAGPADKMALENNFVSVLRLMDRVAASKDNRALTLSCKESGGCRPLTFARYYPNPVRPADYNPFVATK